MADSWGAACRRRQLSALQTMEMPLDGDKYDSLLIFTVTGIDKNWDLQTILWLQFQTLFDPNVLHIGSSYSELLFCSFSFFPADGVSHMLSTLYLFKHWQKLGFATLNRPIILCLSEACQCLLNTMLDFVNFLSDFIIYS